MARRRKKYRVNRKPAGRAALDAGICEVSAEHETWLLRRQKFIDSLPRLAPGEVLRYLEDPRRLVRAVDFHRLKRAVLNTPDGREMFDDFGRRWMRHYEGSLPATWWADWPPELTVYKGV